MAFHFTLYGVGTTEIAAYGVADAEVSVAKELKAALPEALVRISEVRRAESPPRIVETFVVGYSLQLRVHVEDSPKEEDARRQAFRTGRAALVGTRFGRTIWEKAVLDRV